MTAGTTGVAAGSNGRAVVLWPRNQAKKVSASSGRVPRVRQPLGRWMYLQDTCYRGGLERWTGEEKENKGGLRMEMSYSLF